MENGTRRIGKLTNLEPGDGVQNLMQTGWDQQTVNEAEDARTHRTRRDDPLAARMDSMLHWRPNVAKDRGQNQTEEAGRDWHEAFATKEAEESGSLMFAQRLYTAPPTRPVMLPASTPMRLMSPWKTVPAALVNSPIWNQAMVFRT